MTRYLDLAAHTAHDAICRSRRTSAVQSLEKKLQVHPNAQSRHDDASECVTVLYLNAMGTGSTKSMETNTDGYLGDWT